MIIEMTTGCICDSLTVDGIEEINLTDDKRKEVLIEISNYVITIDIKTFGKLIDNYLSMFNQEDDLDYITDFYQSLINDEIITPLQQFPKVWNHEAELLTRQFRQKVHTYIATMHPNELNILLQDLLNTLGKYEFIGHCDCCGDIIEKYTLNLCVEK